MKEKSTYLCIHGHFYQPPRDNPWLEDTEYQESAAPYHDWNERIYYECYLPNAMARVLDEKGRIVDIVNNYEQISFNFGPTLLNWIKLKHPVTYQYIQAADQVSAINFSGHGNAIAQVYNHMIMPLANRRDKVTQVRWGIQDFRLHFGRLPEAMWLAETACDEETLEVLIEHGIKFIILEPNQAQCVRGLDHGTRNRLDHEKWHDVSNGSIDPKYPYRCFLKKDSSRFIDIFFYDGPISKQAGFGDLAYDAGIFADRLSGVKVARPQEPHLIHIATDGETYGHHKAYGERALAYLLRVSAAKRGLQLTNYGEYLEKFPPLAEVQLKEDASGGTSWSCAHGVKRWKEHCGCRGDGPHDWTQHWRKPLRESLDWLRDELVQIYETFGGRFFKDVWEARNDYILVMQNRSEKNIYEFLSQHTARSLSAQEVVTVMQLLECQRYALYMYTSCGWFFTELSGLESSLLLKFASKAMEFAKKVTGLSLEEEFLKRLGHAKSNMPSFKDGKGVYEQLVAPARVTPEHIVTYHAITTLLSDEKTPKERLDFYVYELNVIFEWKQSVQGMIVCFSRLKIKCKNTLEEKDYLFVALHIGVYDFECYLKPFYEIKDLGALEKAVFSAVDTTDAHGFIDKVRELFGEKYLALKDLPLEQRMEVIRILTQEMTYKISAAYEKLYDENWKMSEIYRSIHLPLPEEIRYAVEYTLARRLKVAIMELARQRFDLSKKQFLARLLEVEKSFKVKIDKQEVNRFLSRELAMRTKDLLVEGMKAEVLGECFAILDIAKDLQIELHLRPCQDHLVHLFKKWRDYPATMGKISEDHWNQIFDLGAKVGIHSENFKKAIQKAISNS